METKKHNSELFYEIQGVYDLNFCAVYTLFQAVYLLCYSPVTDINQQRMSFKFTMRGQFRFQSFLLKDFCFCLLESLKLQVNAHLPEERSS